MHLVDDVVAVDRDGRRGRSGATRWFQLYVQATLA